MRNEICEILGKYRSSSDERVCLRFFALALDMWVDCETIVAYGGVQEWLEDQLENLDDVDELVDQITDRDIIPVDYEGDLTRHFANEYGVDWNGLQEAFELVDKGVNAEVVNAGLECEIPVDKIEEAYIGEYDSISDYARDYLQEAGYLSDVPDFIARHIDYESMGQELEQYVVYSSDHYFRTDW